MGKKICNDTRHAGYDFTRYRHIDERRVHPDSHVRKIGEKC